MLGQLAFHLAHQIDPAGGRLEPGFAVHTEALADRYVEGQTLQSGNFLCTALLHLLVEQADETLSCGTPKAVQVGGELAEVAAE